MKIYITRHGQVLTQGMDGKEPQLSELGQQQAARLGAYMRHLGFSGKIYTSPYACALETAQIIADYTGSLIVPWAPMGKTAEEKPFTGMTLARIRERYTHIDPEAALPSPWWTPGTETMADVPARVQAGLEALMPGEDIMLVGHSATVACACNALKITPRGGDNYNCSFSMFDSEDAENFKYMDVGHLPYAMRTFNAVIQAEEDKKLLDVFMENLPQIPEEVLQATEGKLLHIGDTYSFHYPYIQWLIEQIKPNIIFHTGDFSDEVKVGRSINVQDEYTRNVAQLAEILKNSGAEAIYLVPGNNDVWEVLERLMPFARLLQPNTVVNIGGVSCALGHSTQQTTAPAQWSFFGHSTRGDDWSPEDNDPRQGTCRYNVLRGNTLILLNQRKQYHFPRPKPYRP